MVVNYIILFVSLIIYFTFGVQSFTLLCASLLVSFFAGLFCRKSRAVYIISLVLELGFLVLVKLVPLTNPLNLIVPLGASYYTLKNVSYIIDVRRGRIEPEKNVLNYALYAAYLPGLYLGPIIRYEDAVREFSRKKELSADNIWSGLLRIAFGGLKKYVAAARIGIVISTIVSDAEVYRGSVALFAMFLYSFQLFFDFSGGIDIVLGISRLFGFKFAENFNSPYLSQNMKEFWRRWHMTLGAWLRDYVYIPLGGSRVSAARHILNTIVTFLISGLWHGIHYVLWGFCHGVLVLLGGKYNTKSKALNIVINFILVSLLWAFFVWPDTGTALKMLGSVFTVWNPGLLSDSFLEFGISAWEWVVLIIVAAGLCIADANKEKLQTRLASISAEAKLAILCAFAVVILIFGVYGMGFNAADFIYSRF